ncbi:Gfo/Idh/MocA family oxidoreductase [candidate division KSB1 bacterium]|nr:Gfo/Idh/MocA family oxidoreductase [candidate division KSB1 bacterium]
MNVTIKVCLISFLIISCSLPEKSRTEDTPVDSRQNIMQEKPYTYQGEPLRVGVIGFVHDHVGWILGREKYGDIEIVGIVEPNRDLAIRYCKQYGYPIDMVFSTIKEMLDSTHPEAVTAYNMISEHIKVVEQCAPRGIHVMVEKPMATNLDDAEKMIALANQYHISLITNYETSWYGSNSEAYKIVHKENEIGDIRRIIFRTGHKGPIEIGCTPEFLEWLTDPIMNGGGALTDFGCYGANLATWFMRGEEPQTVSCITQQIKPDLYPKVVDEATIVLTYPKAQVIIQASWNWSQGRKEMEVHGKTGFVICENSEDMVLMKNEKDGGRSLKAKPLPNGIHDPFAFFTKVIKDNYSIDPFSPSSLENNKVVMQILDAAKYSAKTRQTVVWDEYYEN